MAIGVVVVRHSLAFCHNLKLYPSHISHSDFSQVKTLQPRHLALPQSNGPGKPRHSLVPDRVVRQSLISRCASALNPPSSHGAQSLTVSQQ
eukprot:3834974-Rhodomonas_salina.1